MSKPYRYTLKHRAAPKSMCENCDRPKCFVRYIDTDTGELLPYKYGRCDHEVSCSYHLNPYRADTNGNSYARQIYFNEKPQDDFRPPRPQIRPAAVIPAVVDFPTQLYLASLKGYERNALAILLRRNFGLGVANDLMRRFRLGTSSRWPGACIFWLIDQQDRVRAGQIVLLDATGHTVKDSHRRTTWVHTALTMNHNLKGQPVPGWLDDYNAQDQKSNCLFGLPQLASAPASQPVALVESPKTAMIATVYMPEFIWMATTSKSFLTLDRLRPLKGRQVVLWPDAGAYTHWQAKAAEFRELGFDMEVSKALENSVTEQQRKDGIDIADVFLSAWPGHPPSW